METEKMSKKVCSSKEIDRLSDLPDHIIHHILFLLDTKYVVRTSALSKKWTNLWIAVPVLNFNSNSFKLLGSFKKFVLAVLDKRNRKSTVGTFRFFYNGFIDDHFKKRVIHFAISHGVNDLILDLGRRRCCVPPALLQCQTYKTIQFKTIDFAVSFGFPTLTALHLQHCSFNYGSGCFDLLEFLPGLKNLSLHYCDLTRFKIVKISGSQLLNLSLRAMSYSFHSLSKSCKLEISAPKLTYFSYKDSNPVDSSVLDFPSLQNADVKVFLPMNLEVEIEKNFLYLFKFFQGLHNAQSVTLSYSTVEALIRVPGLEDQQNPFTGMKSLKLTHPGDCPFPIPVKVVNYLLNGCPSSETIVVELPKHKLLEYQQESTQEGADPPMRDNLLVRSPIDGSTYIPRKELGNTPTKFMN